MHWLDLFWIAIPSLHHHNAVFSWMDLAGFFGIGGIFLWSVLHRFASQALVPVNDPRLEKSINMKN
jgi:hypothetical protein